VAFGGGGARGFAHIGVVRAMAEAGVAIDRVGGTSMGSVMAAEVALGWDWQTMLERTKRAFALDPLKRDSTLPLVSLVSGRRVVRMFEGLFGDARAEDCWLPFLSVSCNMTRAEPAIHRDGLLWQRVRSSSALPGIGPPVVENGEFFIDGAILNNLPADLLMDESAGPVVAVNVSPREDLRTRRPDSYHLSGWRLLWDRLLRKHAMQHPSIVWVLQRTVLLNSVASAERLERMVSLYLHPPLDKYEMFGWNLIEEIVRLGYENARKPVLEWALKQSEDLKRSNDTRAG
jgi:NTE family protein